MGHGQPRESTASVLLAKRVTPKSPLFVPVYACTLAINLARARQLKTTLSLPLKLIKHACLGTLHAILVSLFPSLFTIKSIRSLRSWKSLSLWTVHPPSPEQQQSYDVRRGVFRVREQRWWQVNQYAV
jgi:hypothetical protein